MNLSRVGDPIGNSALDLVAEKYELDLTEPNSHAVEPVVPLAGQTTICILNELLPLLPGDNRVISFESKSAGDSLHEQLKLSFGVLTLKFSIIGTCEIGRAHV